MAKQPMKLKEFFKTNEGGVPQEKFKIKVIDDKGKSIVNPDHSALVIGYLKQIDNKIDSIIDQICDVDVDNEEAKRLMADADAYAAHGRKIAAQAFYLDTKDRNSWNSVKQGALLKGAENPALLGRGWIAPARRANQGFSVCEGTW